MSRVALGALFAVLFMTTTAFAGTFTKWLVPSDITVVAGETYVVNLKDYIDSPNKDQILVSYKASRADTFTFLEGDTGEYFIFPQPGDEGHYFVFVYYVDEGVIYRGRIRIRVMAAPVN